MTLSLIVCLVVLGVVSVALTNVHVNERVSVLAASSSVGAEVSLPAQPSPDATMCVGILDDEPRDREPTHACIGLGPCALAAVTRALNEGGIPLADMPATKDPRIDKSTGQCGSCVRGLIT